MQSKLKHCVSYHKELFSLYKELLAIENSQNVHEETVYRKKKPNILVHMKGGSISLGIRDKTK